jgi:hypothetical protein
MRAMFYLGNVTPVVSQPMLTSYLLVGCTFAGL